MPPPISAPDMDATMQSEWENFNYIQKDLGRITLESIEKWNDTVEKGEDADGDQAPGDDRSGGQTVGQVIQDVFEEDTNNQTSDTDDEDASSVHGEESEVDSEATGEAEQAPYMSSHSTRCVKPTSPFPLSFPFSTVNTPQSTPSFLLEGNTSVISRSACFFQYSTLHVLCSFPFFSWGGPRRPPLLANIREKRRREGLTVLNDFLAVGTYTKHKAAGAASPDQQRYQGKYFLNSLKKKITYTSARKRETRKVCPRLVV